MKTAASAFSLLTASPPLLVANTQEQHMHSHWHKTSLQRVGAAAHKLSRTQRRPTKKKKKLFWMTSDVSLESCRHVSEEGYSLPPFLNRFHCWQESCGSSIVWHMRGDMVKNTLPRTFFGQAEHTWTAANSGLREKQSRVCCASADKTFF